MKIEKTLISLTQYMEKQEIPYVIVGGFAAAAWGRVRTIYDIAIIVDQNKMDINKFVRFVQTEGFKFLRFKHKLRLKENLILVSQSSFTQERNFYWK